MPYVDRKKRPEENTAGNNMGGDIQDRICGFSDKPIEKLMRIKAEEYDPCGIADISPDKCADHTFVSDEMAARIELAERKVAQSDVLNSGGRHDEAMLMLNEAAIIIKKLNVIPPTVTSFWQYLRGEDINHRMWRLLGKTGGRQFLAVADPRDSSYVLTFDPAMEMTGRPSGCIGPVCSYVYMYLLGASSFSDMMDELNSWVRGSYRCMMPLEREPMQPPVASAGPAPQTKPDAAPPAATTEAADKLTTQFQSLQKDCMEMFPAQASRLWAQSSPVSKSELSGTSWIRCGYKSRSKNAAGHYTPVRQMRFDLAADRLHVNMDDNSGAKQATYNLREEGDRLIGMHEDPALWLIPPALGGPQGDWGPIEIRKLGRDILIYFRVPSVDGKDYFYAYAIARHGEAI